MDEWMNYQMNHDWMNGYLILKQTSINNTHRFYSSDAQAQRNTNNYVFVHIVPQTIVDSTPQLSPHSSDKHLHCGQLIHSIIIPFTRSLSQFSIISRWSFSDEPNHFNPATRTTLTPKCRIKCRNFLDSMSFITNSNDLLESNSW